MKKGRAVGVPRKREPLRGVKVTYRVYLKDGSSKYMCMHYGISVKEENPVEFLKQYIQDEVERLLTYETYQDIDYYKIISIDGQKVNIEIHR